MKLRNKKTGEIIIFAGTEIHDGRVFFRVEDERGVFKREINSLAELNEEWEDYEEPKKHYEILAMGAVMEREDAEDEMFRNQGQREIGNYFDTREEAEKAVEKFKAWKRLKDKGFRFEGINEDYTRILQSQTPFRTGKRYMQFNKSEDVDWLKENWKDLNLLFGGEE